MQRLDLGDLEIELHEKEELLKEVVDKLNQSKNSVRRILERRKLELELEVGCLRRTIIQEENRQFNLRGGC